MLTKKVFALMFAPTFTPKKINITLKQSRGARTNEAREQESGEQQG